MKITSIETCLLTIPTPRPISTEWPHHKFVVADIATDEGVRGQGYSMAFGAGGAEGVLAYRDAGVENLLIGEDPLQVEHLWDKMYRGDRGVRRVGIAGMAISALDIALWDLAGKAARLPLYKPWGGYTDRVSAYGSGGWGKYTEAELIAEAERYAAAGCRYYKMKIHHPDPKVNRARVEAVRKALPGMRMMVDVNQKLDLEGNRRQAALLEEFDLVWYEEPVLADDLALCEEVAKAIRIPVATGANNYTRYEFRGRLQRDAEDRPSRRGARHRHRAARRARALAAGVRRALQRLPGRVHGLGAEGSVRGAAALQGRRVPHPGEARAWHRHHQGSAQEVPYVKQGRTTFPA